MKKLSLALGLVLAIQIGARAEDYPKADIFGGFSYINTSGSPRQNLFGWQTSVAGNLRADLAVAGDFGGQYRSISGVSVSLYEYLFGPQLRFRTDRGSAFVHALLGGATARGSVAGASASSSGFAMGFGGGLDVQVTKTIAVRVIQLDYVPEHVGGSWGHNVRLGFGVVFQEGAGRQRTPGRRHRR